MGYFQDMLQGGDFPGSDTTTASRNGCINDGDDKAEAMLVFIGANVACRFNSQNGYEFASFGRVPGATEVGGIDVEPAPC